MHRLKNFTQPRPGFTKLKLLIAIPVLIALAFAVHFISHAGHHPAQTAAVGAPPTASQTATTKTNPYAILSPATVPSKAPECSQQLTFDSNGNSQPVQCTNGGLNVLEWNALATLEPVVMTLGYSPTESQVESALCTDANSSDSDANTKNSNVVEATTYQITALYYGWSFSPSPTAVLTDGGC